jgi:hypothetical protein
VHQKSTADAERRSAMKMLKRFLSENLKTEASWPLRLVAVLTLLFSSGVALAAESTTIRWDMANISVSGVITPGGIASAFADDNSKITLTGSGTFVTSPREGPLAGTSARVTGGGTWQTFDPNGGSTGSGTYTIRLLTGFDTATGSLVGSGLIDTIGDLTNTQAGLAVFNVDYSDGSRGILVVSCTLAPFGTPTTPPSIFEGITASKGCPTSPSATCGSVDYWNRENGLVITTADQTIFHIVPKTH